MKNILLLLVLCGPNYVFGAEYYKSYVQINSSTEAGKLFVLAVLSPISGNDENDRAIENFTLSLGETQEKMFKNKYYPNREYLFKVEAWQNEFHKMGITVDFNVVDAGVSVYQNQQVIGAWEAFNKAIK